MINNFVIKISYIKKSKALLQKKFDIIYTY